MAQSSDRGLDFSALIHSPKLTGAAIFTALLGLSFPAQAGDWYRWRGPDMNGISKEAGWQAKWPAEGPKQLWKASVGTGFSSMSVSQGRVYTMGNANDTDTVFCFDANTGELIWNHAYPSKLHAKNYEGGPSATPAVDGDRVYTLGKHGDLFCLDAAKGTVKWSKNIANEVGAEIPTWCLAGSALVEGDRLILNVGSAGTAVDKMNGKVLWKSGNEPGGYSTPVPFDSDGERCVALFIKQDLIAVRVKDGKELWRHPWKTSYDVNAADPIIAGDRVFVSSGYNHGAAVLKISGRAPIVLWQNKNMRNHFNSCVLWQGHLYGVDENELACLNFDTGEKQWGNRQFGKGSLMLADGKLIALGDKGELIIAEALPEAFNPISRAQVLGGKCWTMPVLSNGRIYCRNARGDLVCLDVSASAKPAAGD